ncbi:MAG: ferric reductase-like transmembrane domain-containing protein [Dehalococcoidia bacterium]
MNTARLGAPAQAVISAAAGVLAMGMGLQLWTTAAAADQPLIWWAGRAAGFVAYVALWLSMMFGLAVSSKGMGGVLPKKLMMDLHQQWTLSAVIATVVHVVTLVFHAESGVTPWAAIVPFASARLTGPVGIGTVALFGLFIVAGSSWLRTRIPYSAWRGIHALAFGTMILALWHGWTAGTDTSLEWARWLYVASAALLIGGLVTRVGLAAAAPRKQRARA